VIRGLITLAAVAVLTTSCAAAQKGGPYAGLEAYDAGTAAHDIIDQETSTPGSPLHNRELVVAREAKGTLPGTHRPVWVVSMENFDHVKSKYCLYLWGRFTPFHGSDVKYDIDSCPDSGSV
jgi:hypothetical protein